MCTQHRIYLSDSSVEIAFHFTVVGLVYCISGAYLLHAEVSVFFLMRKAEKTRILFLSYLSAFRSYESMFREDNKKVDKKRVMLWNYHQKKIETIQ